MSFSEKLDFLMNLTNTSNSILAKQTSLDPSFVSRLRSGSRLPSKNENYISGISKVLAKRCSEDYQLQGFKNRLREEKRSHMPGERNLELIIESWLRDFNYNKGSNVGSFIKELDEFSFRKASQPSIPDGGYAPQSIRQDVYHGIEGKRSAVLQFLRDIIQREETLTLYLYSDEELSWMIDDPLFTQEWARLFMQVLQRGNKVKIVHTLTRSLDEMFAAIREWMPFYLTGNIEPYYYPRTRDSNFRRTIFIAHGLCAISSNSISRSKDNNLNFYLTEKETLQALTKEFEDFLRVCRPLMKIFNMSSRMPFMDTIHEFEAEKGDCILKSRALSSLTLPLFALEMCLKNHPWDDRKEMYDFHRNRHRSFINLLETNSFTEIIQLPHYSALKEKRIPIGFTVFSGKPLYYDVFTFRTQLENMLSLLKHYPNYRILVTENIEDELTIYAKENLGLVIMKYDSPSISFAINEPYMTQSFWDYLKISSPGSISNAMLVDESKNKIQEYIRELKDL